MAEGILGLGSSGAAGLNQDLIDKLKKAEKKATVEPIEKNIENITAEKETFGKVKTKVNELLDTIKPFDLFVKGGVNAFEQKAATTSGDSVTFKASDTSALTRGVTTVEIEQLAQKDVYQSNTINASQKDANIDKGNLTINVKGQDHTFDTNGKNYTQLVSEINRTTGVKASIDQVGSDSYRLILKSTDSGLDNKLTITEPSGGNFGFTNTVVAQDLKAKVDGIEYNVSSNTLKVDGLEMTANKTGVSSINISDDTTQITTQMEAFVNKYNELVSLVDDSTNAASKISDKSGLRDILSQVKDKLFGMYGDDSDKSIFNYGIELNKSGYLSIDNTKFSKAVEEDLDGLKDLFIGKAEKEGLGTQLKATLDQMNYSSGTITGMDNDMSRRETTLNEDKTKAEKALEDKYKQLSLEFASYSAIITGFESSFSGLKMMIQQSTVSK